MSLLDRSHLYNFERPAGSAGFFDYQLAAIQHCVERLQQGLPAVLGLDTGLGKTCTVGEVLRRLGGTARWISPGGLIRQTAEGLRVPPWGLGEDETPLVVVKAETGKELRDLQARTEPYHVAVVNRALGTLRSPPAGPDGVEREFTVTVVDEAHQMTPHSLRTLGLPRAPILLVSACARDSNVMMDAFRPRGMRRGHEWSRSYGEACFIVDKTERVLRCIGGAVPHLVSVVMDLTDEERKYYINRLISNVKFQTATHMSIHVALAAGRLLGEKDEAKFVKIAAEHATKRPVDDIIRNEVRAACYRLELPEAPAAAIVEQPEDSRASKRRRTSSPDDENSGPSSSSTVCSCCGLNTAEYRTLYRYHISALPPDKPIWAINDKAATHGFHSTLVRFPTARSLDESLSRYPPPPGLDVFILTSAKSAAYRARLVRRFASHGGQRYKLCVLARAVKNAKCPPLLLKVLTIGHGFFHKELISYIANPRILVTDQTVDVGFDLHRHIDSLTTSHVLCSSGDMQQLVGRLARISVDRIGTRDTIDVVTPLRAKTLDEFFAKHLATESTIGEDEAIVAQRERDSRRAKDRRLTTEMRSVLASHAELGTFFERIYSAAVSSGLT